MFRQNTTTWSPGCICVLPITTTPSPLRISPPMVVPLGRPRSFTGCLVIFEACLDGKLRYIGIGKGEAFYVAHIGIQHHLVDMAGGNHLLVDDRADVEAFSHAYIVDIFYFGYGFSYTHAFCCQTGKNVCFRVSGQCHKGFRYSSILLL